MSEKQSTAIAKQRLEVDFEGEVQAISTADAFHGAEDVDTSMGILKTYAKQSDETGDATQFRD